MYYGGKDTFFFLNLAILLQCFLAGPHMALSLNNTWLFQIFTFVPNIKKMVEYRVNISPFSIKKIKGS